MNSTVLHAQERIPIPENFIALANDGAPEEAHAALVAAIRPIRSLCAVYRNEDEEPSEREALEDLKAAIERVLPLIDPSELRVDTLGHVRQNVVHAVFANLTGACLAAAYELGDSTVDLPAIAGSVAVRHFVDQAWAAVQAFGTGDPESTQ